ncbi:unnamed protein product [Ilex paraguariensis]|uniref:Uncharacterized protein n=1 Tax=Ilex paraguariensis TaxID=185542 RepID=A0ABC8TSY7_9AQUA
MMDYMNMDDRSIGMFWVVSYTMAQAACETVMNWLTSAGVAELLPGTNPQSNERLTVMREVSPLPISLISGFSINLCLKLVVQMEESMLSGQVVPNIAMVETYARLLLIAPHSVFRSTLSAALTQRNQNTLNKPGASLLVLEILNYRLLALYRYQGKSKHLMYEVTKMLSILKAKRGDHRIFRLAENLCMNLILSLRDFFVVKKEGKGPTEFTETLNRITITTLAIIIKTRGIAEADHLHYLQTMLEQILATSQHSWSEKTLRYFPAILRDALIGRIDKRGLAIKAWQQALTQRNQNTLNKPGASLLVLEILNYRLLALYRYQGKSKHLMYEVTKMLSILKAKRGDHRIFRLAENLCMNLILSLRDFFVVKKEGKGPTEFTETLNRITITTLAIIIKTRGIAEADHLHYLQTMLEQILATSQHSWSEKTLRYFPAILRDALIGRIDKRGLAIKAWQQVHHMTYSLH